jgi:hypothetical protein
VAASSLLWGTRHSFVMTTTHDSVPRWFATPGQVQKLPRRYSSGLGPTLRTTLCCAATFAAQKRKQLRSETGPSRSVEDANSRMPHQQRYVELLMLRNQARFGTNWWSEKRPTTCRKTLTRGCPLLSKSILATQERPANTARDAMERSRGTLGDQYLAGVGHGASIAARSPTVSRKSGR